MPAVSEPYRNVAHFIILPLRGQHREWGIWEYIFICCDLDLPLLLELSYLISTLLTKGPT